MNTWLIYELQREEPVIEISYSFKRDLWVLDN